jgi:sarcosine oxidase
VHADAVTTELTESRYDAVVVGLGAWGSAALCHLARRGLHVLGVDRFRPPHRRGSHHGQGRIIRRASFESARNTGLVARSYQLWEDLQAGLGAPLLTGVGGINVGPLDHHLVAGALAAYRAHAIDHELLDSAQAAARFPWLRCGPGEVAVYEPTAAVLHPERAVRAHLSRAEAAGARVRTGEPMLDWGSATGAVAVRTPRATYLAGHLVLTAGAWQPECLHLNVPLTVERQVVAVYDVPQRPRPSPTIACVSPEQEQFYGLPEGDAYKVAIHHGGAAGTADTISRTVTGDDLRTLARHVAHRLPGFPATPSAAYVCTYTNTPDRQFIVGRHPGEPRAVIAAGDSGRGFKFAPVIGEALADLVEARPREDLAMFSPQRFAPAA